MVSYRNDVGSGALWVEVVNEILAKEPKENLLDLMCHRAPHTPMLGFESIIFVDIQNRGLDFPLMDNNWFVQQDAIEFLQTPRSSEEDFKRPKFDTIICSDGIEHLSKRDGLYLLALIKQKSKSSVIFTPYGDYKVDENSTHPDTHKSGWTETDFEKMGYSCIIFPNFHPKLNKGAIFAYIN
jgi:hypothetical protein